MEHDLNEEPLDPSHSSDFEFDYLSSDESESSDGDWPPVYSQVEISNALREATTDNAQDETRNHQHEVEEEGIVAESGKEVKGNGGSDANKRSLVGSGSSGNFYDCNICFKKAIDPVLTCCGHLFCWPCFYQLPYAYSKAKECPVCNGEVTPTGIVPIYGNASVSCNSHLEFKESESLRVPPRPQAPRIESIWQLPESETETSNLSVIENVTLFHYLVHGFGDGDQSESPIMLRIKEMLGKSWMVKAVHVHRESDKVADWLASHAPRVDWNAVWYSEPSEGCRGLLLRDIRENSTQDIG
ncbi:uncharacterized protein LOC133302771 [Gastrolobium bilobum]|uniref:uncharacterized protein LOC133302771 n=1 Tax=Gastrolobium bilobum TaxID=150636 RepID=UPI002AB14511|nr:uncharacterized protein LOC133302771 [Gastrolobium bilobum]